MITDKIKVVIAEEGKDLQDAIKTELENSGSFTVAATTSDGNEVIEKIKQTNGQNKQYQQIKETKINKTFKTKKQ